MKRRAFLATALAASLPRSAPAANPRAKRAFVASDVDPLRRVLVHFPGDETQKPGFLRGEPADPPGKVVLNPPLTDLGVSQHRTFASRLAAGGAEIVSFKDALDDAVRRCRRAGRLDDWVQENLPDLAGREDEINASVLVGAIPLLEDAVDEAGVFQSPVQPLGLMFFTRDVGVMTPRGLVIGNIMKKIRAFETALLRLAARWSGALRRYPIAFDAGREGVWLQGGDLIVADETTLLLGVGNLTAEAAARPLARRLGMDVVTVQLPGSRLVRRGEVAGGWDSVRSFFLHLDSVFNLVDAKRALTIPYFFEEKYAQPDPFKAIAQGFSEPMADSSRTWSDLREIGRVRRYLARTGEPDRRVEGLKLVDYLRSRGFEFTYVGGPPPEAVDADYLRTRVVSEVLAQAANVVALGPKRVLAFEGNTHTIAGLKASGVDVEALACSDLARWHGGPHCMSMPLERGAR